MNIDIKEDKIIDENLEEYQNLKSDKILKDGMCVTENLDANPTQNENFFNTWQNNSLNNDASSNLSSKKRTLLIDALDPSNLKSALIGHNKLLDFEYHKNLEDGKGSIHLAIITRVLPGLQAVFVKYKKTGRDGFLPFSEIDPIYLKKIKNEKILYEEEEFFNAQTILNNPIKTLEKDEFNQNVDDAKKSHNHESGSEDSNFNNFENDNGCMVFDESNDPLGLVFKNQVLMVQVTKEERDSKGASLSTFISLTGRYCIYMPNRKSKNAISKNIMNLIDKKRLDLILNNLKIENEGSVLILSSAIRANAREINQDYNLLLKLWSEVKILASRISSAPNIVYFEENLIKNIFFNINLLNVKNIIIQGETTYNHAIEFAKLYMPAYLSIIKMHNLNFPIFSHYGIDFSINRLFSNIVDLKSGGYIVFNKTEALVAIDVNSGKNKDEICIEETALKTNLEAISEIMIQVKLRKIAGLIVIDLIGMRDPYNTKLIENTARRLSQYDKSKIQIHLIDEFSLLVLSRQRLGQSLIEVHGTKCESCSGFGYNLSNEILLEKLLDDIKIDIFRNGVTNYNIFSNQNFLNFLINSARKKIMNFESKFDCELKIHLNLNLNEKIPFGIERIETDESLSFQYKKNNEMGGGPNEEAIFSEESDLLNFKSIESEFILEEESSGSYNEKKSKNLNLNAKNDHQSHQIRKNSIIEGQNNFSIKNYKEDKKHPATTASIQAISENLKQKPKSLEAQNLENMHDYSKISSVYRIWNEWLNL